MKRPLDFSACPVVFQFTNHGQCLECEHPFCVETRRYYLPVVREGLRLVAVVFDAMFGSVAFADSEQRSAA